LKRKNNTYEGLSTADVAIDFSVPSSSVQYLNCFLVNVPVISGTTGWLEQYDEMVALCTAKMALSSPVQTLVWASIYSLKSMNI
jgi:4-hydroxy-tetrahydrodipicolinate reductase